MAERGRFISIEGGEGSGKSRLLGDLRSLLVARGLKVVTTREPGGTPVADAVRALFSAPPAGEPLTVETEALLVAAARSQHVARLIRPSLQQGAWVLTDRYADSTRVYQGELGGLPRSTVESLIALATGGLTPDLTLLLDCDVDVSLARLAGRGETGADGAGRYDGARREVHERLRAAYMDLAMQEPQRIVVLHASDPPEQVLATALAALEARFGRI